MSAATDRAIQIDLDIMCYGDGDGYDYDDLNDYVRSRLDNSGANIVYVQVFSENFDNIGADKNRMADYLLFDPGHSLNANVMNAHIFKAGVKIIRELLPDSRILVWTPSIYNAFLMEGNTVIKATAEAERYNCIWYRRASPFDALTHTRLAAFFEALGQSSEELDGIMFQDDLLISNWEDVSEKGIQTMVQRYGLVDTDDDSLNDFLNNDENEKNQDWRRYKVQVLDDLSKEMFASFRRGYQSAFPARFAARETSEATRLVSARDYYEAAVLSRDAVTGDWYGQDVDTALDIYDQVVVMAYPNMSIGADPASQTALLWLNHLVTTGIAIANRNGKQRAHKLIFKLQSVCWSYYPNGEDYTIPAAVLQQHVKALTDAGATGIGFYPALEGNAHFNMASV